MNPLAEIWKERRTLVALVGRELRLRQAGSLGGLAWSVLVPLAQLLILTTVFSLVLRIRLSGIGSDVPFAITLAWGFFPWLAFQDAVSRGTTVLVDQGTMLKRMGFSPALLLAQPVLAAQVQLAVSLGLLLVLMPFLGVGLAPGTPLLLLAMLAGFLLALGAVFLLGTLQVYFRDTSQIVGVSLQALFYLTPIVYAVDMAPESLRFLLALNPLSGVVGAYRAFALGMPVPVLALAWSFFCGLTLVLAGSWALYRARPEMADLV